MPVKEANDAATTVAFNWPHVTAVLGGISMFLTFIGTALWKYWDSKDKSSGKNGEEAANKKMEEIRTTVANLTKEYEVLRVQVDHLRSEMSRVDASTAKEIEKLESEINKLIDVMIKLVSEDD